MTSKLLENRLRKLIWDMVLYGHQKHGQTQKTCPCLHFSGFTDKNTDNGQKNTIKAVCSSVTSYGQNARTRTKWDKETCLKHGQTKECLLIDTLVRKHSVRRCHNGN